MNFESSIVKAPWETPSALALTDTESRADEADVAMRNIAVASGVS